MRCCQWSTSPWGVNSVRQVPGTAPTLFHRVYLAPTMFLSEKSPPAVGVAKLPRVGLCTRPTPTCRGVSTLNFLLSDSSTASKYATIRSLECEVQTSEDRAEVTPNWIQTTRNALGMHFDSLEPRTPINPQTIHTTLARYCRNDSPRYYSSTCVPSRIVP